MSRHFTPQDWARSSQKVWSATSNQRDISTSSRAAAGATLRRTEAEAAAAQNEVKRQIDNRLNDIRAWTNSLEKAKGEVGLECSQI